MRLNGRQPTSIFGRFDVRVSYWDRDLLSVILQAQMRDQILTHDVPQGVL
jgi:hypothetical protein